MNRYAHIFQYIEPGNLFFRWMALMLHPFKLEVSSEAKSEEEKEVTEVPI